MSGLQFNQKSWFFFIDGSINRTYLNIFFCQLVKWWHVNFKMFHLIWLSETRWEQLLLILFYLNFFFVHPTSWVLDMVVNTIQIIGGSSNDWIYLKIVRHMHRSLNIKSGDWKNLKHLTFTFLYKNLFVCSKWYI